MSLPYESRKTFRQLLSPTLVAKLTWMKAIHAKEFIAAPLLDSKWHVNDVPHLFGDFDRGSF